MKFKSLILISIVLFFISCEKENNNIPDDQANNENKILVEILNQELHPLQNNPQNWTDDELRFFDQFGEKAIIGLGESTHGTANFFKSKHRIFKYLVENHGFKIFAIEADFGESVFINDAVQRGSSVEIFNLMKEKMLFWTWKTTEVLELIQWMCEYNKDKPDDEKLQYVGVDCQSNDYNTGLLFNYLEVNNAPFIDFSREILTKAKNSTSKSFEGYDDTLFNEYLKNLDNLQDSLELYKNSLVNNSSEKDYYFNLYTIEVIRQVSLHKYYYSDEQSDINYRDLYMAENTSWFNNFFGEKVCLWAHNGHIGKNPEYWKGGSMGHYLSEEYGEEYVALAFTFSKGSFTAIGNNGAVNTVLKTHSINSQPQKNTFTDLLFQTDEPVYSVLIENLLIHEEWIAAFEKYLSYIQIGSVYNGNPSDYYTRFDPSFFDLLIHFDNTTNSNLL